MLLHRMDAPCFALAPLASFNAICAGPDVWPPIAQPIVSRIVRLAKRTTSGGISSYFRFTAYAAIVLAMGVSPGAKVDFGSTFLSWAAAGSAPPAPATAPAAAAVFMNLRRPLSGASCEFSSIATPPIFEQEVESV